MLPFSVPNKTKIFDCKTFDFKNSVMQLFFAVIVKFT